MKSAREKFTLDEIFFAVSEESIKARLKWIKDEIFDRSQTAMAKAMGCSESHISGILNKADKNPSTSLLENLVKNIPAGKPRFTVKWIVFGGPKEEAEVMSESHVPYQTKAEQSAERLVQFIIAHLTGAQLKELATRAMAEDNYSVAMELTKRLAERETHGDLSKEEEIVAGELLQKLKTK